MKALFKATMATICGISFFALLFFMSGDISNKAVMIGLIASLAGLGIGAILGGVNEEVA